MITVQLYDLPGKLIFSGQVPEDAVKIKYGYGEPTTATISMPVKDLMSSLAARRSYIEDRTVPFPLCPHGRVIREISHLEFAGAIYLCSCCENFFGSFSPIPSPCPTCSGDNGLF